MRENRKFQRVNLLSSGWILHNGIKYSCRLENISKNGALVSLKLSLNNQLHPGDNCNLTISQPDQEPSFHEIGARIVRAEANVVALEFSEMGTESHERIVNLIQKELHLLEGGQKLINLAREVAGLKGIEATTIYFDKGELNPEREIHTLRLSIGEHSVYIHVHRDELEAFSISNTKPIEAKIYHAVERLTGELR